jgi:hypothetical protein
LVTRYLPSSTGDWDALFAVELACVNCHHAERLEHDVRIGSATQVSLLREVLELETGLPVVIAPPDDPSAGVREPRRPPPGDDSSSIRLPEP